MGSRLVEVLAMAHGPQAFSVNDVRARFPALRRVHRGHLVAYFDGPGGTQVPLSVAGAVGDYLLQHNANTHWSYPTSAETDAMIAGARSAMADFLGGSVREIAFGQNMTSLTFHLARALGRKWSAGDELVVTELDHQANVAPWKWLERERGVTVKVAKLDVERGALDWTDLERQLGPKTKLLAIGAASNALGTINDVRKAVDLAHAVGALVFVDAVHYAPHRLVDIRAFGCDFLACSAYKFHGPHVGILWGRQDLLARLEVPKLEPAPDDAPERLETGTQSHEGIAATLAAVDFLASLGTGEDRRAQLASAFASIHAHEMALFTRLWEGLARIPGVKLFGPGPAEDRTPTVALTVRGVPSREVSVKLAERGLFCSNGDFYATTVVRRLGLEKEGLLRIGLAVYSSDTEVERLLEGVAAVAKG
jgi:cysteine desulfurase family protein (TIGR01976 family)